MVDNDFAARIRQAIEQSGLKQRHLAEKMKVSPQTVTKWRKRGYIHRSRVPLFCELCGVRVDWLLTGEGNMRDEPASAEELADWIAMKLPLSGQVETITHLTKKISQRLLTCGKP